MYDQKSWYKSKAVWGGIVAMLAGVAGAFNVAIGPEDQELIVSAILGLVGAVSGALAVYGRIVAKKQVK